MQKLPKDAFVGRFEAEINFLHGFSVSCKQRRGCFHAQGLPVGGRGPICQNCVFPVTEAREGSLEPPGPRNVVDKGKQEIRE